MKRILLSVMMVAVCMPLHGVLITFQKDGELDREYCIARSYL